jgi:hypothetical protein
MARKGLPQFDAATFETLSHQQKLEVLTAFIDALDPVEPVSERKPRETTPADAPQDSPPTSAE